MILDTNALSAMVRYDPAVSRIVRAVDHLYLPVVVQGEYEHGILGSSNQARTRVAYQNVLAVATVLPILSATATVYAGVKHDLKGRGRPIPENDLWIAALALQHGLPILSRDAHFDAVPGVTRLGW